MSKWNSLIEDNLRYKYSGYQELTVGFKMSRELRLM